MLCPRCNEREIPEGLTKYGKPRQLCKPCSREAWKEKISQSSEERSQRRANFLTYWYEAVKVATAAANAVTPTPMNVVDTMSSQTWHVPEGACGFAYVHVLPGNSAFCRWLVEQKIGYADSYHGGCMADPVALGTQSIERREAGVRAAVEFLKENKEKLENGKTKLRFYVWSRLD